MIAVPSIARKRSRTGAFTIIELVAAAAMLAVILGTLVPTMLLVQTHRRESALRLQALQAAENLLERVLALDWQDIQPGLADEEIGAEELLASLSGGSWSLAVVDESAGVSAKRVTVGVSYGVRGRTGTVELTGWSYQHPQKAEES